MSLKHFKYYQIISFYKKYFNVYIKLIFVYLNITRDIYHKLPNWLNTTLVKAKLIKPEVAGVCIQRNNGTCGTITSFVIVVIFTLLREKYIVTVFKR